MRRSIAFLCRHFVTVPLSKRIKETCFIFYRRSRLECRFASEARRPRPSLANGQSIRGSAKRPSGVSLVYSPVTQIMSPVIRLKESIEHRGGGPIRKAFRREVRGYNCRLVLLSVRGRVNRLGWVSCLGDRGNVFHILSFYRQTLPQGGQPSPP